MLALHRNLIIGCASTLALAICAPPILYGQRITSSPPARKSVTVPFVGCKSDGQVGPLKAPTGNRKIIQISAQVDLQLAYYKAESGPGVLAPRGWYCFSTYGSSGSNLYVSPKPISGASLFSDSWKGFPGPAIQISSILGDTSGRFGVARVIAKVFPTFREFVQNVMNENIEAGIKPPNTYIFGPYPKDRLTYRGKNTVEYLTPGNAEGLGTHSELETNADPISGVVILIGQTPDLLQLSMRLPKEQRILGPIIIQQVERDAARLPNSE